MVAKKYIPKILRKNVEVVKGKIPECFCGFQAKDNTELFTHMTKVHSLQEMIDFIGGIGGN